MPEDSENKHRDYSIFDNMSTETLEDILRADSQLPNGENSDVDAILYIMEVIAKREREDPTGRFTNVQDAWASFDENYLPCTKDDKSLYDYDGTEEQTGIETAPSKTVFLRRGKHRLMRVASIVVAFAIVLLAGTVTASALGFDLWGTVAKWTKDTFGFSTTGSSVDSSQSYEDNNSLQSTLNEYGITADLAPSWYPKGYIFESVDVAETPLRTTFYAIYKVKNNEILMTITSLSEPSTSTFEKDDDEVTVYSANGIEHYIMTNLDLTNVVWKQEAYECSISGGFSLEEAKKIIDSIYERK